MRFPSIKEVAQELSDINANVEGETDIRLQIYEDGKWVIRVGDSSYDLDHRGYWGSSFLPGVVNGKVRRFNSRETAKELLDQARSNHHNSSHSKNEHSIKVFSFMKRYSFK